MIQIALFVIMIIQMTQSETSFRKWALKNHKGCLLKKIADYKQTCSINNSGLPDYVMFFNGNTIWWEVKMIKNNKLNIDNHFTEHQLIVFKQMLDNGINVNIFYYHKSGYDITTFKELIEK